jgi:hypothetical protein
MWGYGGNTSAPEISSWIARALGRSKPARGAASSAFLRFELLRLWLEKWRAAE